MIDLHCHLLPGIDDGPATIDGSVAIARAAAAAGTRTIVATPHVSARYPNDLETITRLREVVAARLQREAIALEVVAGAEIAITRLPELDPSQLAGLGLGGGPWLLVEPPFAAVAAGLEAIVRDLLRRDHRVLLAHPERCPALHRDPAMLRSLVADGVLTSITAGSLIGRFGAEPRRFALGLLREGLAHNVSSDAHDDVRRPPGMADELQAAGFAPLGPWLTQEVPAAILAGGEIPPRPPLALRPAGSRRWRWWRR